MRGKNTIFINGRQYDAVTGLPVDGSTAPTPVTTASPKRVISDFGHSTVKTMAVTVRPAVVRPAPASKTPNTLQRSKTLRREAVRRPHGTHEATIARPARTRQMISQSPSISKFAAHPQQRVAQPPVTPKHVSAPVRSVSAQKPAVVAAVHRSTTKPAIPTHTVMSSRQLKESLIAEKLASVETHKKSTAKKKVSSRFFASHPRATSVMTACFALVLLGGYLTYLNMPNLSVRVAASQAGVDAKFPEYRPDGYRFNGPIAYAPGEVTVRFQSNGGKQAYEIKQKNSSWDSQAVLDNYVTKESKSYLTYSEQGLTVYTYENKAAWVNGGVLYTIDGDAPLSNDQVLRIAASL